MSFPAYSREYRVVNRGAFAEEKMAMSLARVVLNPCLLNCGPTARVIAAYPYLGSSKIATRSERGKMLGPQGRIYQKGKKKTQRQGPEEKAERSANESRRCPFI